MIDIAYVGLGRGSIVLNHMSIMRGTSIRGVWSCHAEQKYLRFCFFHS
jgi:hypothetical protein